MTRPLAICLEDLHPAGEERRYLKCVALVGRQPGLRVTADGRAAWLEDESSGEVACELWVSADDRLILYRPAGAPPVDLHRSHRSLVVPEGKPVVLIDGDVLARSDRWSLRVHVHGWAPAVAAPSYFTRASWKRGAKVAAAVALSAAIATSACGPVEVRDQPPDMEHIEEPEEDPPKPPAPESLPEPVAPEPVPPEPVPPIDVREDPPDMIMDVEDND